MGTGEIILISIGLAMDCFAVSLSAGACTKNIRISNTLKIAFLFGGFQSGMAFAGWLAGAGLAGYIEKLGHRAAFILLAAVGIKMIVEAFKKEEDRKTDYCSTKILLVLSVATSIDALVVGISLSFLKAEIITPVVFIGMASFLFALAGVYIGRKAGEFLGTKAEVLGGLILIGIGVKVLLNL